MIVTIGPHAIELCPVRTLDTFCRIESDCNLKGRHPTVQLLHRITDWLDLKFGIEATPCIAWQIWWVLYEIQDTARKAMQQDAELAFWYGVRPGSLSERDRLGLMANLPRVKAQETLHAGRFSSSDMQGVYALVLTATGDKTQAERAKANAAERYAELQMKRGSK